VGRIRTIKPEFFKHSGLFDAERESGLPLRLGFAGLWTCCDREGRFKWRPRELKLDVLPYDDCDFSSVLDALAERGFVVKYGAAPEIFGHIPSWKSNQICNPRESQSKLPNPFDCREIDASATRGERVDHAGVKEGKGMEGNGEGNGTRGPLTICPEPARRGIDPSMMARGLCERLNLSRQMGPGSVYMAVYDRAQIEDERGGDLEKLCDRMVEAYQAWMGEAQSLEYQWGVAKFFGDGWWDKPEAWPRKSTPGAPDKRESARVAFREQVKKRRTEGEESDGTTRIASAL
jgi:hypothetical protein